MTITLTVGFVVFAAIFQALTIWVFYKAGFENGKRKAFDDLPKRLPPGRFNEGETEPH